MPLEDELAAASKKHFPSFQQAYGALGIELRNLGLKVRTGRRISFATLLKWYAARLRCDQAAWWHRKSAVRFAEVGQRAQMLSAMG